MKLPIKIAIVLFFMSTFYASAQDNLFCKTWKVKTSYKNGIEEPMTEITKSYRLTLNKDYSLHYTEEGFQMNGIWIFDELKKIITITFDKVPKKDMKVLKISDSELIIEAEEDPGPSELDKNNKPIMKICLVPIN